MGFKVFLLIILSLTLGFLFGVVVFNLIKEDVKTENDLKNDSIKNENENVVPQEEWDEYDRNHRVLSKTFSKVSTGGVSTYEFFKSGEKLILCYSIGEYPEGLKLEDLELDEQKNNENVALRISQDNLKFNVNKIASQFITARIPEFEKTEKDITDSLIVPSSKNFFIQTIYHKTDSCIYKLCRDLEISPLVMPLIAYKTLLEIKKYRKSQIRKKKFSVKGIFKGIYNKLKNSRKDPFIIYDKIGNLIMNYELDNYDPKKSIKEQIQGKSIPKEMLPLVSNYLEIFFGAHSYADLGVEFETNSSEAYELRKHIKGFKNLEKKNITKKIQGKSDYKINLITFLVFVDLKFNESLK